MPNDLASSASSSRLLQARAISCYSGVKSLKSIRASCRSRAHTPCSLYTPPLLQSSRGNLNLAGEGDAIETPYGARRPGESGQVGPDGRYRAAGPTAQGAKRAARQTRGPSGLLSAMRNLAEFGKTCGRNAPARIPPAGARPFASCLSRKPPKAGIGVGFGAIADIIQRCVAS